MGREDSDKLFILVILSVKGEYCQKLSTENHTEKLLNFKFNSQYTPHKKDYLSKYKIRNLKIKFKDCRKLHKSYLLISF